MTLWPRNRQATRVPRVRTILGVIVLTLTACGSTAETTTEDPVTAAPTASTAPAETTLPPSTTSIAEPLAEIIEVTFDGETCTSTGPYEVPAGEQSFVLIDLSTTSQAQQRAWAIDASHTYDDLLALQGEPGEYISLPEWATTALTTFRPIDRDLADNELGNKIVVEPGEYAITVGTGQPSGIWLCGQLIVVAS